MTQDSFAALPDLLHYQNRWWICGDVALGVANQVGTPEKLEDDPNGCLLRGIYFFWSNHSDLTRPHPKWWFSMGNPLISGKRSLVKYYKLARFFVSRLWVFFFVLNSCLLIMVPSRFSWFLITNYPSWCLSTWLGSSYFPTIYYSRVLMETHHSFSQFQF